MNSVLDFAPKPARSKLVETPTRRKILWALEEALRQSTLVIIRGGFGVGKTSCFDDFAAELPDMIALATLSPATKSLTGALRTICKTLSPVCKGQFGVNQISGRSKGPSLAYEEIVKSFRDLSLEHGCALLIIDEAQHAQPDVIDQLRALFDEGVCGLVVAGNERLFNARRGRIETADFGALFSRAHHVLDIAAPTEADIDAVLDAHGISGQRSREMLRERAAVGGLREVILIIDKAQTLSGGGKLGDKHLKAAAATTGLSAAGWSGRGR